MFVVFDLDGTLANCDHRTHFLLQDPKDWDAYFEACEDDKPYPVMIELLKRHLALNDRVEIWTGRRHDQRLKTDKWLLDKSPTFSKAVVRMRPVGDARHDLELKGDWLREQGMPDLIYDDRNSMVKFWRENGIRCLQVQEGDF